MTNRAASPAEPRYEDLAGDRLGQRARRLWLATRPKFLTASVLPSEAPMRRQPYALIRPRLSGQAALSTGGAGCRRCAQAHRPCAAAARQPVRCGKAECLQAQDHNAPVGSLCQPQIERQPPAVLQALQRVARQGFGLGDFALQAQAARKGGFAVG